MLTINGSGSNPVVLTLELAADRLAQFWRAADVGVLRRAVADRVDRGFLDVVRRIEIRLTGAKTDNVFPGGLQLTGFSL